MKSAFLFLSFMLLFGNLRAETITFPAVQFFVEECEEHEDEAVCHEVLEESEEAMVELKKAAGGNYASGEWKRDLTVKGIDFQAQIYILKRLDLDSPKYYTRISLGRAKRYDEETALSFEWIHPNRIPAFEVNGKRYEVQAGRSTYSVEPFLKVSPSL